MSLAEIKRLHALVLAGKNAATERDDKIRVLAGAAKCPRCKGLRTIIPIGEDKRPCPDCNGTGQPPTQTAIATELGVSRQAIGQIVGKTG